MPYNPGVTDRSGEILGAGIMSGASSLSQMLEHLAMRQEKKDDEEKFKSGLKRAFGTGEMWRELGFSSKAEFDNAPADGILGIVHGKIAADAVAQHEQERALTAEKLQELAGTRQARTRFNSMVSDAGAPSGPLTIGALAGDPSSLAPGSMAGAGANMRRPALSLQQMEQFAAKSNLGMDDQVRLAQIASLAGKADPESLRNRVPETMKLAGRDVAFSRSTGMFQVLPDMTTTGAPVVDQETGDRIPGLIQGPSGRPVRLPGSTEAQQKKLSVEALVEGEKALRAIDDDISAWNSRAKRATTDKTVTAPDPNVLKNLQHRKARLESALQPAEETPGAGAGPAASGGDANAVRAAFKAGQITKEEALKRLRAMGMK